MASPPSVRFGLLGTRAWPTLLRRSKNRRLRPHRFTARPPGAAGVGSPGAAAALLSAAERAARRRRLALVALPLLAMAAGGVAVGAGVVAAHRFVTRSPHFRLLEIRTTGLRHLSADDVRARAGVALGDNLFAFSLDDVALRLRGDPWIATARVHRELPSALAIGINERDAAVAVALGPLYLTDGRGEVFKRATLDEAAAFPVVTGVARDAYIHDRDGAQALIRDGLAAMREWRKGPARPPLGEVHVDAAAGTTLYTRAGGVAIHLGHGDERTLTGRLARVDAVLAALAASSEQVRVIHADASMHPERVTVRLGAPVARGGLASSAPSPPEPRGAAEIDDLAAKN